MSRHISTAALDGGRAADCLSGCRRGKEEGLAAGAMVCWDRWGGQWSGGNSAVFNQPLTTFLVAAMVWRLSVFFLCSYRQFRRCWRLFRSPGAGRCWAVSGGGLGLLAVGSWNGRGSGKRDGASQDGGRVLPHILPTPPRTLGVAENRPGGLSAILA